jgi:hypothetical protein
VAASKIRAQFMVISCFFDLGRSDREPRNTGFTQLMHTPMGLMEIYD